MRNLLNSMNPVVSMLVLSVSVERAFQILSRAGEGCSTSGGKAPAGKTDRSAVIKLLVLLLAHRIHVQDTRRATRTL